MIVGRLKAEMCDTFTCVPCPACPWWPMWNLVGRCKCSAPTKNETRVETRPTPKQTKKKDSQFIGHLHSRNEQLRAHPVSRPATSGPPSLASQGSRQVARRTCANRHAARVRATLRSLQGLA